MVSSWTFAQKLAVGFALAGLTLLLVAVFGYQTTQHLIENDRLVEHTHAVREHIAALRSSTAEAESAERGYVITAQDVFLAPHEQAQASVRRAAGELRRLTSDNPSQQRRLDTLERLLGERTSLLTNILAVRRERGLEAATAAIQAGQGRKAMDAIRGMLRELDDEERRLLVLRSSEAEDAAKTARLVIVWSSSIGTAFVALVGFYIARALASQVGAAVRHIQSSSSELQTAANQQATSSKEQATSMTEITTTISELLATARQIAESARRVTSIAEHTASSARAGDQMVQRTNDSIQAIQRQVDTIVSHMLELGRKSQQIGGILEVINELAEQTNILAINATIEAAGAGDSGKRFSVVADEIRRLADRVGASTKEIRRLIDDIRSSVNKTVMATEGGNKAVDAGARQFGEVAVSFSQIAAMVLNATDAAREIELSTKQQSTAVEQVNVAVATVAQASKETESSSTQTLQTAAELAKLSRELLKVVQAGATA
jgi:methyl-accepting chemotaxis protein